MELWDAYDKDFRIIPGKKLIRGEPIPEGCYHLVADILVRHQDGTFLLMQRSPGKRDGGMWESTSCGSAFQGETALQCGFRELEEETGIRAKELTKLGSFRGEHSFYVQFFYETDQDKDRIRFQEGETVAYQWVTKEKLLSMYGKEMANNRMERYVKEL